MVLDINESKDGFRRDNKKDNGDFDGRGLDIREYQLFRT